MGYQLVFFGLTLFGLLLATYSDLKTRIVSDKLTYSLILLGLAGHLGLSLSSGDWGFFAASAGAAIATFIGAYLLWRAGVWAGGDVKLFTGIAALNPFNYLIIREMIGWKFLSIGPIIISFGRLNAPIFPLTLFIYAIFAIFPYSLIYSSRKMIGQKKVLNSYLGAVKKKVRPITELVLWMGGLNYLVAAVGLGWPFALIGLIVIGFLRKKIGLPLAVLLGAYAVYAGGVGAATSIIVLAAELVLAYALIKFYLASKEEILKQDMKITKLEEGTIAGETIALEKGQVKRYPAMNFVYMLKLIRKKGLEGLIERLNPPGKILANSRRAGGLEQSEVDELKRLVKAGKLKDKIKCKVSVAFIPAILMGYLLAQALGDFFWAFLA